MSETAPPPGDRRVGNTLVLGGAFVIALAAVQHYTHLLPGSAASFHQERERCYGVVRAGQNDCGTASHACAGRAPNDAAEAEWLSLPAGTCQRIVGGRLQAPEGGT